MCGPLAAKVFNEGLLFGDYQLPQRADMAYRTCMKRKSLPSQKAFY